jgi:hypothetical protein
VIDVKIEVRDSLEVSAVYREARSTFDDGSRDGIDVKIEIRDSLDVSAELFERYVRVRVTFFSMVKRNCEFPGCARKPTILFCDNCSAHCGESFLKELAKHCVLLILYPPHTSHAFQVLDTRQLGRLKAAKKHEPRDPGLYFQLDHIIRTFIEHMIRW